MDEQEDKKSLHSDNTDCILKFIHERPACHLRQIKRELKISMGTVQHHLNKLEKDGKITAVRNGLSQILFSHRDVPSKREKSLTNFESRNC